jgi:2-polyprenyl-6-methoxyphenol hydroxylase-like FAD-dependent oxidoreductase
MATDNGSVIVVGGSLAGLALAAALGRVCLRVKVIEQLWGEERGGTGLGVDRELLTSVTGIDATKSDSVPALPVVRTHREATTWHAIYRWLRAVVQVVGGIDVIEGSRIDDAQQGESSARVQGPGIDLEADVVLGADGYRSVVRRAVDPARPVAPYGGFIIWRGLVPESRVPRRLGNWLGGGLQPFAATARLVAYYVPGADGDARPGKRRITFAWYDATRTEWMRERGFLRGNEVISSVPPEAVEGDLREELRDLSARWQPPASEILLAAIDDRAIFGTPLAQYLPEHLANGRIAIVGDAAHIASPMLGAGLVNGLRDCMAIAQTLNAEGGARGGSATGALRAYESLRLTDNRDHVSESMAVTAGLLRSVKMDSVDPFAQK